jgi:predicted transcriptional regulator
MTKEKINHLLVVDENSNYVGIVSSKDIAKKISKISKNQFGFISKLFDIQSVKKLEKAKKKDTALQIIFDMDLKFFDENDEDIVKTVKIEKMAQNWNIFELNCNYIDYIQYLNYIKDYRKNGEGLILFY